MNLHLQKRWEEYLGQVVEEGRFGSASEAVEEGLRLVAEREGKLVELRAMLERSIARGGDVSDEELDAALDAKEAELERRGH